MQQTTTEPYNDSSIIRFGAHKGKRMIDIPARYLLYLFDQGGPTIGTDAGKVRKYIIENLSALKKEAGIK
jgi:uncharacterized protein (DUF3820 family)